jgi:hypothetical protein
MAKRTSFEEKSKGMHASRKLIIDTVFGREDNTQRVHGYEVEAEKKREVGEIWTDKEGKEWEQKDGFKINTTKFDEVRQFLQKITNCSAEECKTIQYSTADKKLIAKTGLCANCLAKEESQLRADGTWPYYEDYKISLNKLAYIRDVKDEYEEALKGVSQQIQILNEDGTTQNWQWDIDIDKVKADIQSDIDGAYDAIEALLERKLALEEKLRELNHPELIKN